MCLCTKLIALHISHAQQITFINIYLDINADIHKRKSESDARGRPAAILYIVSAAAMLKVHSYSCTCNVAELQTM